MVEGLPLTSNVNKVLKLSLVMIFQELEDGKNTLWSDENFQLIAGRKLNLLHVLRQTLGNILSEVSQVGSLNSVVLANSGWKIKSSSQSRLHYTTTVLTSCLFSWSFFALESPCHRQNSCQQTKYREEKVDSTSSYEDYHCSGRVRCAARTKGFSGLTT